jgi:hypothetical protein
MALYCDSYLKVDGITGPGERLDDNLLSNLRSIRHFANTLLKTKTLRDMLPTAVADLGNLKRLFEDMLIRIRAGRISRVYASLYRLFHDWRYYVWVASAPPQTLQRNLWQYFLFDLKGEDRIDKLYECWVFYRVLRTFCEEFDLTMKEIERGESGVATFVSKTDPKLKVAYQRIVRWGWEDSTGKQRVVIPDIIVTRDEKALLIVDAKNRDYYPGSCLHQMERYLGAEGCRCDKGVLVFSSAPTATWTYDARGTRRVIYTHLTPALAPTTGEEQCNQTNLSKIVGLVKQELAAPSDALSASAKVGKVTRSSTVQE